MNIYQDTAEIMQKYFQPTWESKIAFYRERVTEWDAAAMVRLLERMAQSDYADIFHPTLTSHDWLCISTEREHEKIDDRDYLAINYDDRRQVFHLHYIEARGSKVEKREHSGEGQMWRAVESALLRMKLRNEAHGAI